MRYYTINEICGFLNLTRFKLDKIIPNPYKIINNIRWYRLEDFIHLVNDDNLKEEIIKEYNEKERDCDYIIPKHEKFVLYRIYSDGVILDPKGIEIKGMLKKEGYYEFTSNSIFKKELNLRLKHRIIGYFLFGDDVYSGIIDHINRNKEDNSFENLRLCDRSLNGYNTDNALQEIFKIKCLNSGDIFITDNIRKLSKEYPNILKNTNIYRLVHGKTKKSRKMKLLELNSEDYKIINGLENFVIKI